MTSRYISLLLATLLAFMALTSGCETNPITGETQLMLFPEEQDVELGKTYAPEIEKQLGGRVADLDLQNYINSVGQKIARVSQRPYFDYHYVALDDEMVNAFALPGGYVFVTRGMLNELETEAELAAIFAHETAHIVARHVSEQMSQQIGMSILMQAVASGTDSSGAVQLADVGAQLISLGFSRKQEREADLGGLAYLPQAGYDPDAMVETMEMLERRDETRPLEFFSTHPSPENRIAYIQEAISLHGYARPGLRIGRDDYGKYVLDRLNP